MIPQSSQDPENVSKKTTRGLGWTYFSFGLTKVLNLISVSILAHLLPPEDFGIVALATLAIDYLSVLNDLGVGAALIQRKGDIEKAANNTFTLNLLSGSSLTVITFAVAPFAAAFFEEPLVTPILRWLGLTFFISALGSTHNIRLQREMNFQRKIIPEVGNSLLKAIASISLALTGFGVWSLVVGQLIGVSAMSVILWLIYPWKPKLFWDPKIAKELFTYGFSVMGDNALSILQDSFDYLIIGRLYDATALGIYTLAYRLPQMLVINVLWIMTAVLFPAFSSIQDQRDTLRKGFLTVVRYVELLAVPICFGMFVAADPIIQTLFGNQWLEAIPILRILSLYALIISIGFHVGDVYKAIGRPDILLKISIPTFVIRIIILWVGAQYSLVGVAVGHLVAGIIEIVIRLAVAFTILKITIVELIKELRAFIGGIGLLALSYSALIMTEKFPILVQLIVVVMAGAVGYLSIIWFIERSTFINALNSFGVRRKTDNN